MYEHLWVCGKHLDGDATETSVNKKTQANIMPTCLKFISNML